MPGLWGWTTGPRTIISTGSKHMTSGTRSTARATWPPPEATTPTVMINSSRPFADSAAKRRAEALIVAVGIALLGQTDPAVRAASRWLSLHRGCKPSPRQRRRSVDVAGGGSVLLRTVDLILTQLPADHSYRSRTCSGRYGNSRPAGHHQDVNAGTEVIGADGIFAAAGILHRI